MRITLLGTGAAAGWPHPFCGCASCAATAADGDVRAHTSALIDDVLLLDCGEDVPRSAVRLGVRLDRVTHLFVTHDHPDHATGAALLWRHWADGSPNTPPLHVFGPAAALAMLAPWLPPDHPGVTFTGVVAGDCVQAGRYVVRALAADHDSAGAVIYDIADGVHRVLYATDTGPQFNTPPGAAYDLLLLENTWGDRRPETGIGHHDLATFATTIARLRRSSALGRASRIVPIHLGHGNPAPALLRSRLTAMGVELLPDGAIITLNNPTESESDVVLPSTSASPRRTLVIGGARSGKSLTAERLLAAEPSVVYVATARHDAADAEWDARIAAHRSRRPSGWSTIETTDLAAHLRDHEAHDAPLLIDCLTLWLTHVLDDGGAWSETSTDADAESACATAVDELVAAWRSTRGRVIAVSNDVGSGVVPDYPSGRRFRDELGTLNARIAAESDEVLFVEAGIPRSLLPAGTGAS